MISNNPLVSICIPTYNSGKWIKDTIHSALAQTWDNKELIIVDDGSVDNTYEVIKKFESDKVKIFRQENKGACAARNKALKGAKGDFIQWLDADDLLAPNKIENQLRNSDLNPYSKVLHSGSWGFFYFCTARSKIIPTCLWQDLSRTEWLLNRFGQNIMMPNHSFLVSRKLTELVGPWNENLIINQDGEYFTRIIIACDLVKFHSESLCYYRRGNTRSISKKNRIFEAISISHNLCVDHLLNFQDTVEMRAAAANFLNQFVSVFFNVDSAEIYANKKRIENLGGVINHPELSGKFIFLNKILGYGAVLKLKNQIWNSKIFFEKSIDKIFSIFGYR